jgi:hypothetical protein
MQVNRRRMLRAFLLATAAIACGRAEAVVISSSSDAPNIVSPGPGSGWDNVARISSSSCVYLGNRWMITANHVSSTPVRLTDGREFNISVGSEARINNPVNRAGGAADLRIFRLAEDPQLPSLQITSSSPTAGAQVMMIGAGLNRAEEQIGWKIQGEGPTSQWTPAPLFQANVRGYDLLETSQMRWGMNQVLSSDPIYLQQGNSWVFATRFDAVGVPFEAQAALGDSGGAVLQNVNNLWHLAGIMAATLPLAGQPNGTVAFGNMSYAIDLSIYRDSILSYVNRPEPLWQNQVNYFDVDRSGGVNARDVVVEVNKLLLSPNQQLLGAPGAGEPLYDVNGDLKITAQDVVQVVSNLLNVSSNASRLARPAGMLLVPEPSGRVQAIMATGLLWSVVFLRRRAVGAKATSRPV